MQLMVLNDGETYTSVSGCSIIELPDNFEDEDIDTALHDIDCGRSPEKGVHRICQFSGNGLETTNSVH